MRERRRGGDGVSWTMSLVLEAYLVANRLDLRGVFICFVGAGAE